MERFRAQLQTRRRKPGESIKAIYQDIRRLMAFAFPGQSGELYEILGHNCFLNALADAALCVRMLDQQPKTLDDALTIATTPCPKKHVTTFSTITLTIGVQLQ